MKILLFIQNLGPGGKERRFVELLSYLQSIGKCDVKVVLMYNHIAYPKFFSLGIDYCVLNKSVGKKSIVPFFDFYSIYKEYKPDVLHIWGNMV